MNIAVGNTIKRLRQEKDVTQEELSAFLKVSCQAVSKWENNVTMPDIALLPEIAIFFGVTIDALFAIERKDIFKRMERFYEGKIKPEEFEYAKKVLTQMIEDNPKDEEAYEQLYLAYFYYARQLKGKANEYAKKGLEINPFNRQLHGAIGAISPAVKWRYWGDEESVIYHTDFIKKYPDWTDGYCYLATAHIGLLEIEKAEEVIKQGLTLTKSTGGLEILLGDIEMLRGNKDKALQIYDKINVDNIDDNSVGYSVILYNLADRYIKNGRDEKGIMLFNKSAEVGAKMKLNWMSALVSLAFYYDSRGDEENAIESWERIMRANEQCLDLDEEKAEYNTWPKDMIRKLKERQKNKIK